MYEIHVTRNKNEGRLRFRSGSTCIVTTCWWSKTVRIPAGTYRGCSATTMSSKKNSTGGKREGIYIPNVTGHSGIFIHMGTSPSWSDGCIVIKEEELLKIYNAVTPKNGENVTVYIKDSDV